MTHQTCKIKVKKKKKGKKEGKEKERVTAEQKKKYDMESFPGPKAAFP